ncbi:MAG: hypothetical protein ACEPOV_03165 [Hyphomicrobiales bacterium]
MKSKKDKAEYEIWSLSVDKFLLGLLCLSFLLSIILRLFPDPESETYNFIYSTIKLVSDSLLTSSIIGYIFEKIIRSKTEAKTDAVVNDKINSLKSDLPSIITKSVILKKESLKELLSDDSTDDLFLACLENKLKNVNMARQLKKSFFSEIFKYQSRWRDLNHKIDIEEITDCNLSKLVKNKYWKFVDHISYETVLKTSTIKFLCLKEYDAFFKYLKDESYHSVWGLKTAFSDEFEELYFYISNLRINGKTYTVNRNIKKDRYQAEYEARHIDFNDFIQNNEPILINYTIESIIRKKSNAINIQVPVPSHGVRVTFDFQKVDIGRLSVFPYFTSESKPNTTPPENIVNRKSIEVHQPDWVFPTSGITCVWQNQSI